MTLFNLAKKNIKLNTKHYLLYFYPMVFSIVIYFTFVSLQYNKQINESASSLGKVQPAFMAASVLLLLFSAIFIWYSNNFFIRKRKKEVALYSLFGMRKKQVGKLLFYENLIMGIVALGIGMAIGVLLSKLFTMLLIRLMGFKIIANFEISSVAVVQTLIVFIVIIVVTSIHNYRMIYRYTLLDLLKADKQGEKQLKVSKAAAIASLLALGAGYYVLLQPSDLGIYIEYGFGAVLFSLLMILIGSFLFIGSVFAVLLERILKVKRLYFRGTNLMSVSHLRFRMRGNTLILSMIALLSTFTLFVLGAIFGLHHNVTSMAETNYPLSLMYTSQNNEMDDEIARLLKESRQHEILFSARVEYIEIEADLSEIGRWSNQYPVMLLSEKDYQRLAEKIGNHNEVVGKDRALIFNDGNINQNTDPYTGKTVTIMNHAFTIQKYVEKPLLNQTYYALPMVINDADYEQIKKHAIVKELQVYKVKNEKSMDTLIKDIQDVVFKDFEVDQDSMIFSSFFHEYQRGVETYGLLIFIGGFLGIVFLLATGSMLHYKQLTEATADQGRYIVLQKIGMGPKQIQVTIAKQLLPVFLLPLVIAIPNSSFLITALARFSEMNLLLPFLSTIAIYMAIYLVYYFITLRKYNVIVNRS
ncbi:FtsX-like permease family protein [Lederbergia wuyishanensis]|uniref:ABC transport system permease protein n=1 Tax=Lederbergia wuyishanensis TaxID=1347903 RepID=A0ABU0D314_9BACI|nr:ABC transporter permease [Lederbergia wuyishanensis]MCJ8007072.1 ABC transporter permease [Lederbergia wuyishanensis]MDQ0342784.1 putative ABC transport system permease protein [Lederbergia wuyishanensis]